MHLIWVVAEFDQVCKALVVVLDRGLYLQVWQEFSLVDDSLWDLVLVEARKMTS